MNITYTLTFGDQEEDIDFDISADITYQPARISGPPEDCYPDESSCENIQIKVLSQIDGLKDADILDALETQIGEDKIVEDLWEDWQMSRDSDAADRADYYRDSRRVGPQTQEET